MPAEPLFFRMIVPGWPQRYAGRTIRARGMFWGYVALLLMGLLSIGTTAGLIFFGLAVAVHVASITEIVASNVFDLGRRFAYAIVTVTVLLAVVYYPVYWLIGQVASPQQFLLASPPFAAGDVVLVNPSAYRWSDPQPGDVVSFELPQRDIQTAGGGRYGTLYRLQGVRVDRILARAGQQVTSDRGNLLIDGQPSPWLPLNPHQVPDEVHITIPDGSYLIIPSGGLIQFPLPVWQVACIVPRELIHGRVYLQCQPLRQFGRIR